jgi:hypothetical protein
MLSKIHTDIDVSKFISFESYVPNEAEIRPSSFLLHYLFENNIIENYKFDKYDILYGKVKENIFSIPNHSYAKLIASSYNKIDLYYFCNKTNKIIHHIITVNMEEITE